MVLVEPFSTFFPVCVGSTCVIVFTALISFPCPLPGYLAWEGLFFCPSVQVDVSTFVSSVPTSILSVSLLTEPCFISRTQLFSYRYVCLLWTVTKLYSVPGPCLFFFLLDYVLVLMIAFQYTTPFATFLFIY